MSPDLSAELQAAADKATKQINRIMEIEFPKAGEASMARTVYPTQLC